MSGKEKIANGFKGASTKRSSAFGARIAQWVRALSSVFELIKERLGASVNKKVGNKKQRKSGAMKEGLQSNFPHPVLQRAGCLFFSLMKWLEVRDGMSFTDQDLIRIFDEAATQGILVRETGFMNDSVRMLNLALGRNKYRDVRRDLAGVPPGGTAIRRLVRNGGRETHFTLQINGAEWDTKDPSRPAAKTWTFDSFREPV